MEIGALDNIPMIKQARKFLADLLQKIKAMVNVPGTLFFDSLQNDLKTIYDYFVTLKDSDLVTTGTELNRNTKLLNDLQSRL